MITNLEIEWKLDEQNFDECKKGMEAAKLSSASPNQNEHDKYLKLLNQCRDKLFIIRHKFKAVYEKYYYVLTDKTQMKQLRDEDKKELEENCDTFFILYFEHIRELYAMLQHITSTDKEPHPTLLSRFISAGVKQANNPNNVAKIENYFDCLTKIAGECFDSFNESDKKIKGHKTILEYSDKLMDSPTQIEDRYKAEQGFTLRRREKRKNIIKYLKGISEYLKNEKDKIKKLFIMIGANQVVLLLQKGKKSPLYKLIEKNLEEMYGKLFKLNRQQYEHDAVKKQAHELFIEEMGKLHQSPVLEQVDIKFKNDVADKCNEGIKKADEEPKEKKQAAEKNPTAQKKPAVELAPCLSDRIRALQAQLKMDENKLSSEYREFVKKMEQWAEGLRGVKAPQNEPYFYCFQKMRILLAEIGAYNQFLERFWDRHCPVAREIQKNLVDLHFEYETVRVRISKEAESEPDLKNHSDYTALVLEASLLNGGGGEFTMKVQNQFERYKNDIQKEILSELEIDTSRCTSPSFTTLNCTNQTSLCPNSTMKVA